MGEYELSGAPEAKAVQGPAKLYIRLLDRLALQYGDQYVDDAIKKSKKVRKLIAYLVLMKGAQAPVHKLYEALWEQMDIDNPESALKTLVSRARSMLAACNAELRNCIIANVGAYSWNMEITGDVDLFHVEALCEEIVSAQKMDDALMKKVDDLLCMYSGELLPEISQDNWVMVHALRVEEEYKQAVLHAIILLKCEVAWEAIIKVCRMALMRLPFDEDINAEMITALIKLDRRNEAMTQYQHVTDMHLKYMGVNPPSKIRNIYKDIIRADTMLEKDMDLISKELTGSDDFVGAFVCEYAIFKDIYRLQIRSMERYEHNAYLAVLKVSSTNGKQIQPMMLDEIMQKLLDVLTMSLRKGDTVTRYTASQYAILLLGPTRSSIQSVMDRIKLSFSQALPYPMVTLEYLYMPLHASVNEGAPGV